MKCVKVDVVREIRYSVLVPVETETEYYMAGDAAVARCSVVPRKPFRPRLETYTIARGALDAVGIDDDEVAEACAEVSPEEFKDLEDVG